MKRLLLSIALVLALCGTAFAWPVWTGTALITGGVVTDNTHSSAVSVPRDCKNSVSASIPTITSGTVAIEVSNDGTTYQAFYYLAGAAAAPAALATGSGTHNYTTELPGAVLNHKYFRFLAGAAQAADRTITVTCH